MLTKVIKHLSKFNQTSKKSISTYKSLINYKETTLTIFLEGFFKFESISRKFSWEGMPETIEILVVFMHFSTILVYFTQSVIDTIQFSMC